MCQKNDYSRRIATVLLAVVTALFVFGATQISAQVASNPPFTLTQSLIAGGGGTSSDAGGTFTLTGAVGEAVTATSGNTPFTLRSGFLNGAPLAPTAAAVSLSGRVLTANGGGLMNARVTLTGANGAAQTILTRKGGAFRFENVTAGATYIISISSRHYTFQQQVLSALEDTTELNFIGQPTFASPF